MFTQVSNERRSKAAFSDYRNTFARGAKRIPSQRIGWPGGSGDLELFWRSDLGLWAHFNPKVAKNRYWFCFGTQPPGPGMINIDIEINPPFASGSGRIAGAFVAAPDGELYLAHSGGVGGGKKGVGKSQFLDFLRGSETQDVYVEGRRRPRQMLILGRLGSEELPVTVAHLAREVRRFKDIVSKGSTLPQSTHTFTPEPRSRSAYPLGGVVESRCLHRRRPALRPQGAGILCR